MEVVEQMMSFQNPLALLQLPWRLSMVVLWLRHESLAQEESQAKFKFPSFTSYPHANVTDRKERHEFHYLHVLLPFLVGLFLTMYILGLICHYRNIVLLREGHGQRGNVLSSSGTSINSEYNPKNEREKFRLTRSMSQSTAIKVKKFMSNFTNMDTIQT